jgi:Rrf2 family transcriptional regulator, iron-sulfur cluster assembly transcription factor
MILLSKRCVLAIAAVLDVALHARPTPVAAKALAARYRLRPRHLETLLHGLVHANILKGVRGPKGGYELARERRKITVGEIVRTALALRTTDPAEIMARSRLIENVIGPSVHRAGVTFLANLDTVTIEELCNDAIAAQIADEQKADSDYAI